MPKKKNIGAEKVLERKYIFEGHAIKLRVDTVMTGDGRRTTRDIVEHADAVVMVPLDDNGNILLVRQYRSALGKELLELPAGGIDPGEDAATAVIREMQEETGFKPQKIEFLTGFYTAPGFSSEYLHLYLATDLVPSRLTAEDTAGIALVPTPVAKALEMVMSGQIQDAKSICGIMLLLDMQKTRHQ